MIDLEATKKAVREMNAAWNSYARAKEELMALIPAGVTVLHHLPDDPSPLYWSYEGGRSYSDGGLSIIESAGDHDKYMDRKCVIIEAPGRSKEFLPRLEQT